MTWHQRDGRTFTIYLRDKETGELRLVGDFILTAYKWQCWSHLTELTSLRQDPCSVCGQVRTHSPACPDKRP